MSWSEGSKNCFRTASIFFFFFTESTNGTTSFSQKWKQMCGIINRLFHVFTPSKNFFFQNAEVLTRILVIEQNYQSSKIHTVLIRTIWPIVESVSRLFSTLRTLIRGLCTLPTKSLVSVESSSKGAEWSQVIVMCVFLQRNLSHHYRKKTLDFRNGALIK